MVNVIPPEHRHVSFNSTHSLGAASTWKSLARDSYISHPLTAWPADSQLWHGHKTDALGRSHYFSFVILAYLLCCVCLLYLLFSITCISVVRPQSSGQRKTSWTRSSTSYWQKWKKRAPQNELLLPTLRPQHTRHPCDSHLGLLYICKNKVWFASILLVSMLLNNKQPSGGQRWNTTIKMIA